MGQILKYSVSIIAQREVAMLHDERSKNTRSLRLCSFSEWFSILRHPFPKRAGLCHEVRLSFSSAYFFPTIRQDLEFLNLKQFFQLLKESDQFIYFNSFKKTKNSVTQTLLNHTDVIIHHKEINEIKGPNYLALQANFSIYDKQ